MRESDNLQVTFTSFFDPRAARERRNIIPRQSDAGPADRSAAARASEDEDEPYARYTLRSSDDDERTMRTKLRDLQGDERAAYIEALMRREEEPAAVKPGAAKDPYGKGGWREARRTSSKHAMTASDLEALPRRRAHKVRRLRREHLDICMHEDRRDVLAALRDMRKDVEEAKARHKAMDDETRRLQRSIWRKEAHIKATERLMTRGVYCMKDHQSESLEDDEPSSDDLRPVPTQAVAAAAAQSD